MKIAFFVTSRHFIVTLVFKSKRRVGGTLDTGGLWSELFLKEKTI